MSVTVVDEILNDSLTYYPSGLRRRFEWRNDIVEYENFQTQRNQVSTRPRRHWLMDWETLDDTDKDALLELFQRASGAYRCFKWKDENDYQGSCSYTGDGAEDEYQCKHTYYSGETEAWTENKYRTIAASTTVVVNSVTQTEGVDYTINNNTGLITFEAGSIPADGHAIAISFEFYYLAAFGTNEYDELQLSSGLYGSAELELIEVLE